MKKPRGSDRPEGQVFLFVNKNPKSKSLSKSDGAVAKQINRHAQHFRSRKVEAQKITSARSNCSSARRIALDGWHRKETGQGSSSDESSPVSSPNEEGAAASPPQDSTPIRQIFSPLIDTPSIELPPIAQRMPRKPLSVQVLAGGTDPDVDDDEGHHFQDEGALELSSPVYRANFTSYDCIDPFRSTPVRITPRIHVVLQYTLQIYSYAGNNYKLAFLPKHVRSTISQFPIGAVVQRSVYKEHHLYSLMAAMLARMKHVFALSPTADDPQAVRATASHYLRKELLRCSRSGDVDKQTILDILFLCVNEMQYGMYEDVRKHLQIVGKLLHLLDPSQLLDRWISETAAHVDNQLSLSTAKRPVLPNTFDPGPMLPERMAILRREAQNLKYYGYPNPTSLMVTRPPNGSMGITDAIADLAATLDIRMGSQFVQALKMGAFPWNLGRIISDLVDCIEIAKVVWLSPLAVCFDAEWLCRKARAVLRALLAIAPDRNIGAMDLMCKCTECVRVCLLILMTHACTLIGFQTARSNVQRLQAAMEYALTFWCPAVGWTVDCIPLDPTAQLDPFVDMQARFVLWGLLTGCWSAEDQPEEEFFTRRALNICRHYGFSTYEDLHNHMAGFLYSKTLQERSLKRISARLQKLPLEPS
ncbi:uncharacterized protein Z520_07073 [Fonsecaea multimorphosa CBS 102226]|uniref:Uncharacterized protein n=1 Tax=Fonsecaea multimorphosa CBS 102226 TaxID=1442371 RepID=A0A0D2K1U8_9EURO|nr:uncharacterized protein Z520_07073 [Fonsecaea multimorphosa CBS 102226]KIX96959.1 hypothetical protein Z520_07073 [Fonsecaea multimorphosa CBS 102226]OAL23157.1 hypothetical protein AYO22_06650 [Fonsecaea multimorphosa]